jgi:hypothetical protein
MSNRTERRAAERAAGKLTHQAQRTISEAQLAANRANAHFSGGPTTKEGKAKSFQNAFKHGLTGKTVLLPTDDAAEYDRHLESRIRAFQPATDEELALVQSIVDSAWRIARIKSLETGIMLRGQIEFAGKFEDQTSARRAQLIDVETYLKYEKSIRNLNIQEARLHRRLEKDQAELIRLQSNRKHQEMLAAQTKPAVGQNGFEFSTTENRPQDETIAATPGLESSEKPNTLTSATV